EAFILAGKIISLAAGLGVVYFSFIFLEKITGKFAPWGVLFLVISPWYLIMSAFPITDMLYLFFVSLIFYAFLNKSPAWLPVLAAAAGVLTRFEGVLLILSGFVNYFKPKKRFFFILLASTPLLVGLLLFFRAFTSRFFAHFTDIILPQKSYLFMFLHPLEFLGVISSNIFFFVPASFPYAVQLILMAVLLGFFCFGIYRLYKIDKRVTLSILVYEILFLAAKGYIDTSRPDIECRRIFSGLWIFYMISFIGGYFLFKKREQKEILTEDTEGRKRVRLNYLIFIVLWIFVLVIYPPSFRTAAAHLNAYGQKGGYAAAQWLKSTRLKEGTVVLSYTNNTMIEYYLEQEGMIGKKLKLVYFTVPMRYLPENRELYIESFFKELKNDHVDYIIFDYYVVQKPEFLGINDVRQMLLDEKENTRYFRIRQYLAYKGNNVGCVLKPVYDAYDDHAETNY
ncbi:MAG TPA: hypothetical protein VK469_12475, partial [Candidatus Kapabacteria bacterium]|nr:hypothetical protein [Candidatus Kapabacteria bacterium]